MPVTEEILSVDTSPTNTTVFDREFETVYLSLDLIDEPPWNPNEQDPGTFNALVANIKEVGFLDPILVCPRPDVPERYFSISGSHRVKAGRVAGATKIPAMIRTDFTEDMMRFQNMRFNIIKGKLDPLKFTNMFRQLAEKYGDEVTRQLMAFTDRAAFDAVYKQVSQSLPVEMKEKLAKTKAEIKSIDGLAAILNEMFAKNGATLDSGYMVFSYGGQSHLWIMMDEATKQWASSLKTVAMTKGQNINVAFREQVLGTDSGD